MNRVIQPYLAPRAGLPKRLALMVTLAVYSAFTGAAVALLPMQLMGLLIVPLAFAVGIILWILPDIDRVPEKTIALLFVAYIAVNGSWPAYIAVNAPGLPWINPQRIVALALLVVGLYAYATSSRMRSDLGAAMTALPTVNKLFWLFIFSTTLSLAISVEPATGVAKWVNDQIFWTAALAITAWLAITHGFARRLVNTWLFTAIFGSLVAIYEYYKQELPWLAHIPSFLQVDGDFMKIILGSQARAGTNQYRAHGIFSVALVLAHYLSLTVPFILNAILVERKFVRKALLSLGFLAIMSAVYFTGTRTGVIGLLVGVFLFLSLAVYRNWRRHSRSLIGVVLLYAIPVAVVTVLAMTQASRTFEQMTIGGGQHESSSAARDEQWAKGIPLILSRPFGHGPGTSGEVLDYRSPGGLLTIDSYYLTLLLDYGFLGFGAYLLMFVVQFPAGARAYFHSTSSEEDLVGPATSALVTHVLINAVLSDEKNLPVAFVLLGFVYAIVLRQKRRGVENEPTEDARVHSQAAGRMAPVGARAAVRRGRLARLTR